jgi:hypothetical protein
MQPKSLPMSPSRVWELINPGGESAEPG